MFPHLLSWFLAVCGNPPLQSLPLQVNNSIKISGSCYEPSTGRDLEIRAFAIFKSGKMALGQSKLEGIFNRFSLQLPDSTKFLSFEANGFQTTTVPVNFIDKIESGYDFKVLIPMSAKDSLPIPTPNYFYFRYNAPDSMDVRHELRYLDGDRIGGFYWDVNHKYNKGKHLPAMSTDVHGLKLGRYKYSVFASDESLLFDEEMVLSAGINFKVIRFNKIAKPKIKTETKDEKMSFNTRTLYFDQSNVELKAKVKTTLDSVALFLSNQQQMVVHVTGYTDNVGDRDKNLVLSEYRARTVMNYLIEKGVRPEQVMVAWKGSENPVSSNDSEENKIKNRRVVIQVVHK
jgi:outer membrane protein OmpA-like peptidoglycan-associated protein